MINRVRTLLVNRNPNEEPYGSFGEEYIPPEFRKRVLPASVQQFFQRLFGTQPDPLYVNIRVHALLALLHSTELHTDTLTPDARITYLPPAAPMPETTLIISPAQTQLYHVTGEQQADDARGWARFQWQVQVPDTESVVITYRGKTTNLPLLWHSGLSDVLPLPDATFQMRVTSAAVGQTLQISATALPIQNIATVWYRAVDSMDTKLIDAWFAATPQWKTIWDKHYLFAYRVGALLLALANVIEAAPVAEDVA